MNCIARLQGIDSEPLADEESPAAREEEVVNRQAAASCLQAAAMTEDAAKRRSLQRRAAELLSPAHAIGPDARRPSAGGLRGAKSSGVAALGEPPQSHMNQRLCAWTASPNCRRNAISPSSRGLCARAARFCSSSLLDLDEGALREARKMRQRLLSDRVPND